MAYSTLESLQWLAEIDRYQNLLRRMGSEPSIGAADGSSRYMPHIFYVDSVHGNANHGGLSTDTALTTLQAAHDMCTAGRGDVIVCLPGHVEDVASAGAITLSKSGISVLGIGSGALRPTFTWKTLTTASIIVSGANITLKNILCTSTIAALAKLFSVTAAHVTFDAVDYVEDGSTDALQFILTTTTTDDLTVKNCSWYAGTTARSAVSVWIGLNGADRFKCLDNYLIHKGTANNADALITGATTASIGVEIARNKAYFSPSNACIAITMLANSTGSIYNNYFGVSKTGIAGSIAPASCFCFENYVSNEVAKSGMAEPVIDTA